MSYIKVGQKIWLEPLSNAARYSKDPVEEVITKIGRKYFHTQWKGRFDIQSMNQDNGEYSSQYKAYLNKQDIVDANEIVKLKISIPEKIRYGKLSYQTLLAIERGRALRSVAFQGTHFQFRNNNDRSTNVQFTTAPPLA